MSDFSDDLREAIKQSIYNENSIVDEELVLPDEKNDSHIEMSFTNNGDRNFNIQWDYNIASIDGDEDESSYDNIDDACSCVSQVYQAWHNRVAELWALDEDMETRLMNLITNND